MHCHDFSHHVIIHHLLSYFLNSSKKLFSFVDSQQQYQQLISHDSNQEETPNYESDFESESTKTEVKDHLPGQDDNEEEADPVSEIKDEVSEVSQLGEELIYSNTFSDVSRSFTSQSSDHCGERSSWTSKSCNNRLKRQDSTHKLFKDAVVQTQLVPVTYSSTAGQCMTLEKSSSTVEKAPGCCGCSC